MVDFEIIPKFNTDFASGIIYRKGASGGYNNMLSNPVRCGSVNRSSVQ